jgi:hypothetical protein
MGMATPRQLPMLNPPLGYRTLAIVGLVSNILALPLGMAAIVVDPTWRTANIAVVAGAVLPTAVVGIVASTALLRWRRWGQVLAIVTLAMALTAGVPYAIVRLVLVDQNRILTAVLAALLTVASTAALVFWCRPSVRRYLS